MHDKGHILKLKVSFKILALYNGTSCTFHSGYAVEIIPDVYEILIKELAVIANCRFKCVCKNLHTLDIGMEPVFHQIFEVCFIRFDTGVFNINHMQVKVICHLNEIVIEISRLMNTRSERKQGHHVDLGVRISLLHLMEGDSICLHSVCRPCISKCTVSVIGDQCIKFYISKASQHGLIIGAILKLCISSIDQFCVLKVIGTHINNDDIGFLTAVISGIVVELNNAVFIHTGCAELPEMNSTSRPGVVYKYLGTQLFSSLIDPDVLSLGNFASTFLDGISFRVVFSLCHREPYTAARQRAVCIDSGRTVGIVLKRRNTVAQNGDIDHTRSRYDLCARYCITLGAMECSFACRFIERRLCNDSLIGSMSRKSYVLFCLDLFICPLRVKRCGVGGKAHYSTGGLCCYLGAYSCCSSFCMAFFIGADRTAMCCGTDPFGSFRCPYIGSFTVFVAKCGDLSSAFCFFTNTAGSSGVFTGFCTGSGSFTLAYPCVSRVNVFGCCCRAAVTDTGNRSVFCTLPIVTQSIELSCFCRGNDCCRFICKYTVASAAGPISKRTVVGTGCRQSGGFGQIMTQRVNGKYIADCAVSVVYQIHYPRLFSVGSNCCNVVCTSVSSTGRCLVTFILLNSNDGYFFSLVTVVLTGTACNEMIYVVAIFIRGPVALIGIICKQVSVSRSYDHMAHFTDSIFRTSRITYLMRSGAVTVIVTYGTYLTVFGVIVFCSTINSIICHVGGSSRQSLNGSAGCGISPARKGIVIANVRSLGIIAVLERCNRNFAILHSGGFGGVAVYPRDREGLNLVTYAITVGIGVAFDKLLTAAGISLGMLAVSVVSIRRILRVVIRCHSAFHVLGLCLLGNPLRGKYSGIGGHLLCSTGCHCGNFRSGINRFRFGVITVDTAMRRGTLRIIRIPGESNFTIAVTGSGNRISGIIVPTYRAGIGSITINRTGGIGYYRLILVTESSDFIICISVSAYRAGMGGITFCSTGGIGYDGDVVMVAYFVLTALVTLVIVVIVGIVTAFISLLAASVITKVIIVVAVCVNIFAGAVYGTSTVGITCVILVAVAASSLGFSASVITDVVAVVISIGTSIVAGVVYGTSAVGITYVILIGVNTGAQRLSASVITDVVAVVVLVGTRIVAGAIYGTSAVGITYVILFAVAAGGKYLFASVITDVIAVAVSVFTGAEDLVATIITVVVIIAVFTFADRYLTTVVTDVILIGVNVLIHIHICLAAFTVADMVGIRVCMSKSIDYCLCYENLVTYFTVLTFGTTGFGTGCSYCFVNYLGVAEGGNYLLLNQNSSAFRSATVLTFGKSRFGTGGCFRCVDYLAVTHGRDISLNSLCLGSCPSRREGCRIGRISIFGTSGSLALRGCDRCRCGYVVRFIVTAYTCCRASLSVFCKVVFYAPSVTL